MYGAVLVFKGWVGRRDGGMVVRLLLQFDVSGGMHRVVCG
jgi:hypothetical protein